MLDIDLYIVIYIIGYDEADFDVQITGKPVKTRNMWVLGETCRPTPRKVKQKSENLLFLESSETRSGKV